MIRLPVVRTAKGAKTFAVVEKREAQEPFDSWLKPWQVEATSDLYKKRCQAGN
jgi:hypothetical protein